MRASLRMSDAIGWMREAFAELATGQARVPVRSWFDIPETESGLFTMPAFRSRDGLLGIKIITLHARNPGRGLPRSIATVLLIDADSGEMLATIEAEHLTAVRTGAGAGLATEYLARPDSKIVVLFGAGRQAETQLEAMCAVRPIELALVYARGAESANQFAERMSARLNVQIVAQPARSRIAEADIICTATSSSTPVFSDDEIGAGVHVNGVGSYKPTMAEVPPETVGRSRVVVDDAAGCLAEAGDILQAIAAGHISEEQIHAQLGELVLGRKSGRVNDEEVTFFKSVGNAVQDLAVAAGLVRGQQSGKT